jgi:hypothetical protein
MDTSHRLQELKALRRSRITKDGFKSREEFTEWQARVAPLLNFNAFYYDNFIQFSSKVQLSGLSSGMYDYLLSQLDSLMAQAITELELDLTPKPPPSPALHLTEEHGLFWFFKSCTTKTRGWLVAAFITIVTCAYLAGHNTFITQVVDLWRKSQGR